MINREITGTACDRCKHFEVCKYKEEFLDAQEAVSKTSISFTVTNADGKPTSGQKQLLSIDYIEPLKLRCKHAEYKPITRDYNSGPFIVPLAKEG